MAANITLKCGTGVYAIKYAWVNSSGTRIPASGTNTTYGSVTMNACDHVWISSVTPEDDYTSPYKIDGTSFTSNYTYYPSVGGTKNVTATYVEPDYCRIYFRKYSGGGVSSFYLSVDGTKYGPYSSSSYIDVYQGASVYVTSVTASSGYTSPFYYYYGDSSWSTSNYDSINNSINTRKSERHIQVFATEKTTYTTHSVSIKSNHVTASVTYQDKYGESHTLSLSAGSTLTFDARSGSSAYCKVSSIYSTSGYTTPITWQYNTSSGGTATTTISEGGSNTVDTTYNRTIVITASEIPTDYYYKIRYLLPNGSTYSTGSLQHDDSTSGYIEVYTSDIGAPSGYAKTGSYTAISGSSYYGSIGAFRVTSTSSSNPAILGVYIEQITYTYFYRARLFVDNVLVATKDGTTPATTSSSGYSFSLSEVQAMVTIPSHTSFSYATNGNSYCTFAQGYFTLLPEARDRRAYMDLYYTTDQYTLTASFYDNLSRNALSLAGAGSYPYGSEATLLATVRDTDTYLFEGWYDSNYNKVTSSASLNVTVTANKTYYARAVEKNFTLSVYDYYAGSSHSRGQYSLASGYTFNPSVYSSPPRGYAYDHAECPLGTTVTSVTMSSDKSLYLFYTLIPPTVPTATISITERTSNSLSVSATITNILTYSDGWYLCISTDPTFASYSSIQGSGSSVSHTFTGLSAHTTYYFKVVNVYNEQRAWQSSYTTGTTKYASFVWDYNDNIDNRRPTANEWTRLVSFIEAVAGVTVSAAAKATIYVGGSLSHILFNELAQDVNLAQTVSKGTRIFKSVLNALKDKANTLR